MLFKHITTDFILAISESTDVFGFSAILLVSYKSMFSHDVAKIAPSNTCIL